MRRNFSAVFYNGERPVPLNGIISVKKDLIVFSPDDSEQKIQIGWDEVIGFRKDGERVILSMLIPGMKHPSGHREIVCRDPGFYDFMKPLVDIRTKSFLRRHLRKIGAAFSIISIALIVYFWGFLSQIYRFVPVEADVKIGTNIISSVKKFSGEYKNEIQRKRLVKIVSRLKPADSKYSYDIYLLNDPMINAMAVPGGNIIVFKGLLDGGYDDDEIAGVIAHEVSHVELRHGIRQMIRYFGMSFALHLAGAAGVDQIQTFSTINDFSALFVLFKYSRGYELEADSNAVRLLQKSGYDPRGLQRFFVSMEKSQTKVPLYLSTHPETKKRIDNIEMMISRQKTRSVK